MKPIVVVGAGLAGSQAALAIARLGGEVELYEMRPVVRTPAHRTTMAAELVCSNSLRSNEPQSAPGLLKEELRLLDCELLRIAESCPVPAGSSLTVDRTQFSEQVTRALESNPRIRFVRSEIRELPRGRICVLASGPLTSEVLSDSIRTLTGEDNLSFYDAINPVVEADSIDRRKVFAGSRYGKGGDDFLNCPLDETGYAAFRQALATAEGMLAHDFDRVDFFGCPPVERLARSGEATLRFGPMRPVGLRDPMTGRRPFAVLQLRRESLRSESYNMVGFQNQLKFGEQERVFRMVPGLEQAEFVRFGQMHRNTYIRAPRLLTTALAMRARPDVLFAGQLAGVEGYVESMATGLLAGVNAWRRASGEPPFTPPRESAVGSICHYLARAEAAHFAPVRFTFDLLPPAVGAGPGVPRAVKRERLCGRAIESLSRSLAETACRAR